jgi:predicted  nucleic acid-binding Zn-ribbon protein
MTFGTRRATPCDVTTILPSKSNLTSDQINTIEGESMHHDHRQWESDVSMWRDHIGIWKQGHQNAFKELKRIEERLAEQSDALESHVNQLDFQEANILQHEHTVAGECRDQTEPRHHSMADHAKEATAHQHLRDAQERLKKHHHTVMAHIMMLKATLDAAF